MKKLSKIKLQNAVVLESQEMKLIYGGSGNESRGTCGYQITDRNDGRVYTECNLSYRDVNNAIAHAWAVGDGYRWCCDSCSQTSYCG